LAEDVRHLTENLARQRRGAASIAIHSGSNPAIEGIMASTNPAKLPLYISLYGVTSEEEYDYLTGLLTYDLSDTINPSWKHAFHRGTFSRDIDFPTTTIVHVLEDAADAKACVDQTLEDVFMCPVVLYVKRGTVDDELWGKVKFCPAEDRDLFDSTTNKCRIPMLAIAYNEDALGHIVSEFSLLWHQEYCQLKPNKKRLTHDEKVTTVIETALEVHMVKMHHMFLNVRPLDSRGPNLQRMPEEKEDENQAAMDEIQERIYAANRKAREARSSGDKFRAAIAYRPPTHQ
jgi:hypothetical protein